MSNQPPPDPTIVLDMLEGFRRSKTMFAAVSLGVFDQLDGQPATCSALAATLTLNEDALGRLLDACVALQLLDKQGESYENAAVATTYLCKRSPARLTGYISYSDAVLWKMWENLPDAIREGTHRWKQTFGWDEPIFSSFFRTDEAMREFLMGMHGFGLISSPKVVEAFDLTRFQKLVDLGGATGHLAIAACTKYPHLHAAVFDLPQAVGLATEIVGATNVNDRIEVIAGDFFRDPLPQADLYSLGRILHDWTEPKVITLLTRIHDSLPPGGGLLIVEKLIDPDKDGPRWALMQDLGMLLYTEGRERTLAEYTALLRQVGFKEVLGKPLPVPVDAVLAVKG
jgi:acetylserotonin N-methyltransferase